MREDVLSANRSHCALVEHVYGFERAFTQQADRWVHAANANEAAEFLQRALVAEVAVFLHLSEGSARGLITQGRMLIGRLPALVELMHAGLVSAWVATCIAEEAELLDARVLAQFEADIVRGGFDVPDSTIIARVKRAAQRWRTEPIDCLTKRAAQRRGVWFEHACDGMSYVNAYVLTDQARAVEASLTRTAVIARAHGDPRTQLQLLADGLVEAVLHGAQAPRVPADSSDPHHTFRGVRANVTITVPALTLLGLSQEPATMEGVGPISLETAKVLAAGASSWTRVLTHPLTGVRLAYDRTTYRVPAALKRWLEARDKTCRFPGCNRDATLCDVDHITAWEHRGSTNADNLEHLCRKHHRLKHNTAWWSEHVDRGVIRWHSPLGETYDLLPDDGSPEITNDTQPAPDVLLGADDPPF